MTNSHSVQQNKLNMGTEEESVDKISNIIIDLIFMDSKRFIKSDWINQLKSNKLIVKNEVKTKP